ncbi:MAG: glucose-6-phosphate isomerase [Desulfobacterales bacterium]|nr:glucose-6-phosphate isomerase [Desulfobacterales bacterium]
MDDIVFSQLMDLADQSGALNLFAHMCKGFKVNTTESRPALHILSRLPSALADDSPLENKKSELNRVQDAISQYTRKVRDGRITGTTGKSFKHAVVVGIGGSYLGCEFVYTALRQGIKPEIALHFLSNVDIDNFQTVLDAIDPEETLWIIISKSYSTPETLANQAQVLELLDRKGLSPKDHLVTVTAKKDAAQGQTFFMFDYIGGRYSVSSAVGGLPLCLAYGDRVFEAFLKGCHDMDEHALTAPARDNIPLIAALINIWNSQFLGYSAKAIIPYSYSLSKLPAHIQQLYMESLGKCVTCEGEFLPAPAGSIVFGEPGSNAQHSFFQLAHQGKGFPIEFIGVLKPGFAGEQHKADHITNHQELWANLMAQARALAMGKESQSPERTFSGNRPSSILVIEDLSPWSIGCLTAYYEAKTVMEGFIMGVNPFDQFGVELGKSIAGEIREYIKDRNQDKMPRHCPDPATEFYLNAVFRGSLS